DEDEEGNIQIINYHCPIFNLASEYDVICSHEREIYRDIFPDSEVISHENLSAGGKCCKWTITNPEKKQKHKGMLIMLRYKGYLIDLDGTMYKGNTPISGARDFIIYLRSQQTPHLFVTNNSTAKAEDVSDKLNKMDIPADKNQIVTSAVACASYIKSEKEQGSVNVIGENGLQDEVQKACCRICDKQANFSVVVFDLTITYEKIATASLLIQKGATFISTNKDPAIPNERGMLPGNGALTAAIEKASGKQPFYIGKPESIIMETALHRLHLLPHEVLMVGDNYLTDISAGIRSNIDTLMVLTGYSRPEDIDDAIGKPTYIANDLLEWLEEEQAMV